MSRIEKAQIYFAIGLLILGYNTNLSELKSISAGIFLGSATFFFFTRNARL